MPRPTPRQIVEEFRRILVSHGLLEAMRFVSDHSAHRFTALYHFDGSMLRNLILVDKEDESVSRCPDLPVLESYCVYVRDAASRFKVEAASSDRRVEGHPKQRIIQSYCGIPIIASDGSLWGTMCHFDYAPHPFEDFEVAVLEAIAPMIMRAIEDGAADELQAGRGAAA